MAKTMTRRLLQTAFLSAALSAAAAPALAHSVRATMDPSGTSATFTGMARVTCFNDGSGNAAMLLARIRDNSAAVPGLLVSLQLVKGSAAISISDTTPGDANYSDYISLPGGNGEYTMLVNKTAAGARSFDLEWHCVAADNFHTATETSVLQFQ